MRTRNLYASITAASQGTYYFDLPDNTTIRQVTFSVVPTGSVSAVDYVELEVCNAATCQASTNDTQGIVALATFVAVGGGSPASIMAANLNQVCPCNYPGRKGDRIYLNVNESGGATWRVHALVTFD